MIFSDVELCVKILSYIDFGKSPMFSYNLMKVSRSISYIVVYSIFGRVRVKKIDSVPTFPVKSQIVFISSDGSASHHY